MRLLLAAAVTLAALGTPPAHAADQAPTGRPCSFTTVAFDGTTYTGTVDGGPLAAPGSTISMRCTVRVGAGHAGEVRAAEATTPGSDVTVLEPRTVSFVIGEDEWDVHFCTEATVGTTTWYWTSPGTWTTDPVPSCFDHPLWYYSVAREQLPPELRPVADGVLCLVLALSPVKFRETCDLVGPVFDLVDDVLVEYGDPVICEVFRRLAPGVPGVVDIDAEGDVALQGVPFWDCAPYSTG